MKKSIGFVLKALLPLGLGTYLIWYFFSSMSAEVQLYFYKALHEANYGWVFLSLLLSVFSLFSRAYRWKYLLEPLGHTTSFWNRYHALMIGYLMNLTIPRAGEATRSVMLFRSDEVPFSESFGTILAERVFDLILLFGVVVLTFSLGSEDFIKMKNEIQTTFAAKQAENPWVLKIILAIGVASIFAVVLIKKMKKAVFAFFKGIISGVLSVFKTKNPLAFIGHTFLIWILYVIYFGICFFALPETQMVPIAGILLAFVAGSIGISLTNGGLGVFPFVVGLVIAHFLEADFGEKAAGIGYAMGMIIWSSQTIMMILLGLLSFWLIPKKFSKHVAS